jgi:nucleoside phosphorylase
VRYGPIYCCFLDREYSTSVGFSQEYRAVREFLYASLLATDSYIYCSLSAIGECQALAHFPYAFLPIALEEKLLITVSDYNNPDQFLISRRHLYRDDADRYPLYFARPGRNAIGLWEPGYVKTSSSTAYLASRLPRQLGDRHHQTAKYTAGLEDTVHRVLAEREDRAVTIALFADALRQSDLHTELDYRLRATISYLYTRHFLDLFAGVLMTELPCFHVRDRRFLEFAGPSYRLWRHIIPRQWCESSPTRDMINLYELVEARGSPALARIRDHLRWIEEVGPLGPAGLSHRRESEWKVASIARAQSTAADIPHFFDAIRTQFDLQLGDPPACLVSRLIVTCANSTEEEILRHSFGRDRGFESQLALSRDTTYWSLGWIGDTECFLVRTETGSVGGGSVLAVLQDAIRLLNPSVVVSCGVCFGLRPQEQQIGTVILATRLRTYEQVRIGTTSDGSLELRERCQAADADPVFTLRARGILSGARNVLFGEVLSGEKLVDHVKFRDGLIQRFPDALAGEMEGGGLASACGRRRIPWLLIKGISDFADGTKSTNERSSQRSAARVAAGVLLKLLNGGCFSEH